MRSGQSIYDAMCDRLKVYIDVNATYGTNELISLYRNNSEFYFNDLIGWLFGGADWGTDPAMKSKAITALNNTIAAYPGGNDIDGYDTPTVVNLDAAEKDLVIGHYSCCTDAELETFKQTLCDELIS